ncbi:unnamed protein product [Rhodiola kirilowii]
MDWFAWLAETPLDPTLVYNYGVLFACNELTLDDVAYFDHDFLLSMGVAIAKHRLEILKLARAKSKTNNHHLRFIIPSFLQSFTKTTRRGFSRCAKKLGRKTESEAEKFGRKLSPLKVEWREIKEEVRFLNSPGIMADSGQRTAKSGALGVKKLMCSVNSSSPVLGTRRYVSGPINGGRPVMARSPRFSGPLDGRLSFSKSPAHVDGCYGPDANSPWAMLFDDLKPN